MLVTELVNALKDQIAAKEKEIEQLKAALAALVGDAESAAKPTRKRRRKVSKEARARMAEAQRKRWAVSRKLAQGDEAAKKAPKKRRKMSAASKKRLSEALKRRWAERKANK